MTKEIDSAEEPLVRPRVAALITFLLAALVAASLIWYAEDRRLETERARAAALADHGRELQRNIEHALSATYALAALVRREKGKVADFDEVANQMLPSYPGVAALQLAPGGVIRQSVPLAGNEKAIGHDLLRDPLRTKEAFLARDTGKLTLAGPFNLLQGGHAAAGRLPVFLNNAQGEASFWGFVSILIKFPEVLNGVQLSQLVAQGFAYELWRVHPDSGKKHVIAASAATPLIDPVTILVQVPNATWTLNIAPVKGWADPVGMSIKVALGLLFSLILAFLAKALMQLKAQQDGLETMIAKRTSEVLATKSQLQATLDAIPDFLFELGLDGLCHNCHSPVTELWVGSVKDLKGKFVVDALPRAAADVIMSSLREADEFGHSHGMQLKLKVPQGMRWFELSVSHKATDAEAVPRFIVLSRDITERKQAEVSLQENVARYHAITQSANDAIVTADSAGNIVGWNGRAEVMFGYTEAEAMLQPLILLMPERYRQRHVAGMNRLHLAINAPALGKTIELEGLRKDGSEFPMELSLAKWEVADALFVSGTIRDITERRRNDANLRIAATAFESQEGMVVTDADKVILRVNHAFTEITGYSAEEAVGQTPKLLNSGRHDPGFFTAMWTDIGRNGTWQGEIWNRRKNGEVYLQWLTINAVKGSAGTVANYVSTMTDITRHKQAEDAIEHLAFYDALTQLPNRRLLIDRLQQAIAACARSGREGALLFIDLDDFKTLNDTLGHDMGDLLLRQVAQRLPACIREGDTVARFGGDEFVVMLESLSENPHETAIQAETVGEKIIAALNQPYRLAGAEHNSTPSVGVTLFGNRRDTVEELLKRADLAMYQAKAAGRNTLRFFDPAMQTVVTARAALEADLRLGLRRHEFFLDYQPQVDGNGRLKGVEALVRWMQPHRGLVLPTEFIPLAESTGLILPLGYWILEAACLQLVAWAKLPDMADISVAVNVSARQFRHKEFVDQIRAVLAHTGADPKRLKLELTESVLVDDVEDTIAKMTLLKADGVSFSLDDFGTGYSSLIYLKRLPLAQLKIDQSFVRDILTDQNDAAIARTVIALGQSLGLAVIAEGVETGDQLNFLAENGCQDFQGYLFGRPGPARELEQFSGRANASLFLRTESEPETFGGIRAVHVNLEQAG